MEVGFWFFQVPFSPIIRAFKQQRCLLLVDGFYRWKREGKTKQPYYIRLKNHRIFGSLALLDCGSDGENRSLS